jgi:hypothetical protein
VLCGFWKNYYAIRNNVFSLLLGSAVPEWLHGTT